MGSGLLLVTCDTSYSDMKAPKDENPANNRGQAVSMVRVGTKTVRVEGVLASGRKHGYTIYTDPTMDALPDALVGRQLQDEAWIKTITSDDGLVWAARGEGFSINVQ